jgi:alkanesulfonate monooxygenase SsuD/methylene tetrahydromethanopterin reductase-like flavin-dependent oxidoreductase (luciferase family)
MSLRFGLTYDFRNPVGRGSRPFPDLYRRLLAQIRRAEELGFHHVWLSEHHGNAEGYNPSPLTTAAAIAACTERIRIGTFILVLPFHDPLRVAEDAAAIDVWSNGRFELGVGQGYDRREFDSLGIARAERGPRLEEGIELLQRLFREDHVDFDGRFRRVRDFSLRPKPVQPGGPPIWIGARGPKAIARAARLGCDLLTTIGPDPAPAYVEALRAQGRDPAAHRIGQLRLSYVAPSADEAWTAMAEPLHRSMAYYETAMREAGDLPEDEHSWPFESVDELRRSGFARAAMVGTPDHVCEQLSRFADNSHVTDVICSMQLAGMDPEVTTRSMELFAREVIPAFS